MPPTKDIIANVASLLGPEWLPAIYRDAIRPMRTRSVTADIPSRENLAEIQYTLLGIELKTGKTRIACPDLAAARYMRVFLRLGCAEFAMPYDITAISPAADRLETSWQRTLIALSEQTHSNTLRSRVLARSRLVAAMREEIAEIGPGDAMPAFDRQTRRKPA